jgi:hypothetical protein
MVPSEYRHFDHDYSHAASPGNDGILDVRLAVSSDGEQFEWVSEETFVERGVGALTPTANGAGWHFHGEWDAGILFAVRGFVQNNNTLSLYYWGTQMTHGDYPKIWGYPAATSGSESCPARILAYVEHRDVCLDVSLSFLLSPCSRPTYVKKGRLVQL